MLLAALLSAIFVAMATGNSSPGTPYYGTRIGKFSTYFHDVKGDVYAIDEKTIFIKNFKYDGKGQVAHFWAGTSIRPDPSGFIIPDKRGTFEVLPPSDGEDLILRLPDDRKIQDIRWLSVWSKRFRANFGSLIFPKSFSVPSPAVIGPLENTKHGVSSGPVIILDTQTFLVPDFTYDGKGKSVHWWLSRGVKPNTGGLRLRDENGSDSPLRDYSQKTTVVISVPEGHSVRDYETLSIWSAEDVQDFGFAKLPKDALLPPSPRSLGIQPENKLNCEMLNDDLGLEVRWVIDGSHLVIQLISKIGLDEYMALGLSKDDAETKFTSADAAVTWLDSDGRGHAVDYFLQSTDKCEDGHGMCPDIIHKGAVDDLILMNAAKVNDYVTITFKRSLNATDKHLDQHVYTDGPQAILWAVGPVMENGEAGPPRLRTRGNLLLDFGREPIWNCPSSGGNVTLPMDAEEGAAVAVEMPQTKINCPTDLTFRAQMGPPTHKSDDPRRIWFINGLPSPVLTLQRGQTYTFLVEGGTSPPRHHPLYITSSPEGGLYQRVLGNKDHEEIIFAGVTRDPATNGLLPTAEGRLCEWSTVAEMDAVVDSEEGKSHVPLELSCGPGNAGSLQWTPDGNVSDVVFYQSFTEMNMGGKIRVVDWCEETDPEGYVIEAGTTSSFANDSRHPELELERERESVETEHHNPQDEEREEPQSSEIQQQKAIAEYELGEEEEEEEFRDLGAGGHAEERIMTLKRGAQDKIDFAADFVDESPPTHLSDQSERSDFGHFHGQSSEEGVRGENFASQKIFPTGDTAKKPHYRPLHQAEETVSPPKPPAKFSVQFEGGFVPLVRNPTRDKESTNFVPPPPASHFRGPQRPFLFDANESVPFHGTFKPGVPDFSGFNISHYTQAPIHNYNSDHQAQGLHSVPKAHIIQRPLTQGVPRPQEIYRRPQAPFPRPALFGYAPRPLRRPPPHPQQHVFVQLPLKHRPEYMASENEDLDEGSSQRVQVTLQNPGNDKVQKNIMISGRPGPEIKHQPGGAIPSNGGAPVPPIQRRPDIVNEEEMQFLPPQSRPSHANYNSQRIRNGEPSQNENIFPPQRPQRIPIPLQRPQNSNIRPPHPNSHIFSLGADGRPPHPLMLHRPLGRRPEHFQDTFMHKLVSGRPANSHPQRHPVSVGENGSSEEAKPDSVKELVIPSLERYPEIQTPNKISFLPSIEIPAAHLPSHGFPPVAIKKRPVGSYLEGNERRPGPFQENSEIDDGDEEVEEQQLVTSTPSPSSRPYLILPPLPEPPRESHAEILQSEESQDASVELSDLSDYYAADLIPDDESAESGVEQKEGPSSLESNDNSAKAQDFGLGLAQPDKSSLDEDSPPTSVAQESQASSWEGEAMKNIAEKNASEVSVHIPDEHLGEDEPEMPFGTRLPFRPQSEEIQQESHEESQKNNYVPVRRQPQFGSTSLEDASTKTDSTKKVTHSHLNFWPGRKNLLPSENDGDFTPTHDLSSKTLEDIRLPEVSERPAVHDNGTDYSILTHVLSLIGGQPEPMDVIEPRNIT